MPGSPAARSGSAADLTAGRSPHGDRPGGPPRANMSGPPAKAGDWPRNRRIRKRTSSTIRKICSRKPRKPPKPNMPPKNPCPSSRPPMPAPISPPIRPDMKPDRGRRSPAHRGRHSQATDCSASCCAAWATNRARCSWTVVPTMSCCRGCRTSRRRRRGPRPSQARAPGPARRRPHHDGRPTHR